MMKVGERRGGEDVKDEGNAKSWGNFLLRIWQRCPGGHGPLWFDLGFLEFSVAF